MASPTTAWNESSSASTSQGRSVWHLPQRTLPGPAGGTRTPGTSPHSQPHSVACEDGLNLAEARRHEPLSVDMHHRGAQLSAGQRLQARVHGGMFVEIDVES